MHKVENKRVMNKYSSRKEELLEAEVKRLREELKAANLEKSEINSEYEKLTTICRSQRQQLHVIKQALASKPQGLFNQSSSSPDQNSRRAFAEDLKSSTLLTSDNSKSVVTKKSHQNISGAASSADRSPMIVPVTNLTSQPPGWAAF